MKDVFDPPVVFPDNNERVTIRILKVTREAVIVEKHFALHRSINGSDHKRLLETSELKEMVCEISAIKRAVS